MASSSAAQSIAIPVPAGLAGAAARAPTSQEALASGINLGRFVFLLMQLGLLAIAIRQFQIENAALLRLSILAFGGFFIHYWLPLRWRLPFFVAISLGGLAMVMGVANALWIVLFGSILIGICHLPAPFWARAVLLLVAGGILAALRLGMIEGPWSRAIWPILGAMFMFRIIVYFYDLQHENVPATPSRSFAYFFPLPNVCFPMFPVLDYKGFRRGYYDIERHRIYQIGVDWMTRGVVHLILYRAVNYHFTVGPSEVIDPDSLVQHVVANFMLYLRISGTFHLITGMLHLFGFNLIETHKRYCVASSFTDFWRRINIYWKDFMMKLFYMPLYFRLKRFGPTNALVISTLIVFVATWLLHSYQWFWLRGDFPIAWQDGVFWMALAIFVVLNSVHEIKHGRARSLSADSWNLTGSVLQGLRSAGVFFFICVLWSIWTCESLSAWVSMWDFLWHGIPAEGHAFPTYLLLIGAIIVVSSVIYSRIDRRPPAAKDSPGQPFAPATLVTVGGLIVLVCAGVPGVYTNFGTSTANAIGMLRSGNLSRADAALLERGYYEDLTRVNRFNSELWQLYMNRPVFSWLDVLQGGGLGRYTGDFLQQELVPNFKADTPYGTIQTNQWGMRDSNVEKAPPPGTYRIAMLGASTVMGWGVEGDQTFTELLEKDLNQQYAGGALKSVEVLNFGVPGYFPPQQLPVMDKVVQFRPDAVFYVATGRELSRSVGFLADAFSKGIPVPYPYLNELAKRADIGKGTDNTTAVKRLMPFRREITQWMYKELADKSRAIAAIPVWVFVPQVRSGDWEAETPPAEEAARAAGFEIVNLADVFANSPVESIRLAEWDDHPNRLGHRMIEERIRAALAQPGNPVIAALVAKAGAQPASPVTPAP